MGLPPRSYASPCILPLPDSEIIDWWYRDGLTMADLPAGWNNDWSNWTYWYEWQGLPGDKAWMLEHRDGFYGRPMPLMRSNSNDSALCFRAGGLLFLAHAEYMDRLRVYDPNFPLLQHTSDIGNSAAARHQGPFRIPAHFEAQRYHSLCKTENEEIGRNRWVEQKQRGGVPPSALLKMLPFRSPRRTFTA
jgi:hypothetical protein